MNIPEQGIKLHAGNFAAIGQHLQPYLNDGKCYRLQLKPWREKRSLSQNALSHMWYTEISEYLIKSGRTDATLGGSSATSKDIPRLRGSHLHRFHHRCQRNHWEPRHTSQLDTGEMHIFLCKVEAWCAQFGLALTIPSGCEFQQLRDKQEA